MFVIRRDGEIFCVITSNFVCFRQSFVINGGMFFCAHCCTELQGRRLCCLVTTLQVPVTSTATERDNETHNHP